MIFFFLGKYKRYYVAVTLFLVLLPSIFVVSMFLFNYVHEKGRSRLARKVFSFSLSSFFCSSSSAFALAIFPPGSKKQKLFFLFAIHVSKYESTAPFMCLVLSNFDCCFCCIAVGRTYLYIMPFLWPTWLVPQIFWRIFSTFLCMERISIFLCVSKWHLPFRPSEPVVCAVNFVCFLGVDSHIMVADGRVQLCFHLSLDAYATLEG